MVSIQICLAASLVVLVQTQSEGCYNAMDCHSKEIKKPINRISRTEICRKGPNIVQCAEKENNECDDEFMASENKKQIDFFKESLTRCPTQLPEETDVIQVDCNELFATCYSSEFMTALKNNNNDKLCELYPGVFKCIITAALDCDYPANRLLFEIASEEISKIDENFSTKTYTAGCNKTTL